MSFIWSLFILCCFHGALAGGRRALPKQPDGVHLSFTGDPSEMYVTWSTEVDTVATLVEYGEVELDTVVEGTSTYFDDDTSQYIHRVTLTGLKPKTKYNYHCGSEDGWSAQFYFTTIPTGSDWQPRLAVYGDMGSENARALPGLYQDQEAGMYDAILHIGDLAYDLHSDHGIVGDTFLRQIEPIAAYIPYMTCPGNHEPHNNFSHYKNRFTMPNNDDLHYSFNIGPVHVVSINTEYYHATKYGLSQIYNQIEWVEKDLKAANTPENRAAQPWILVMGHRPMYCSAQHSHDTCAHENNAVRLTLEPIFFDYGVDIQFYGHQHNYERFYPLYNYEMYNGSPEEPFVNPGAPVHVVSGIAGGREHHSAFEGDADPWNAYRSQDYGYTRITFLNSTHMNYEQAVADEIGEIMDSMMLVQENHGPFH